MLRYKKRTHIFKLGIIYNYIVHAVMYFREKCLVKVIFLLTPFWNIVVIAFFSNSLNLCAERIVKPLVLKYLCG